MGQALAGQFVRLEGMPSVDVADIDSLLASLGDTTLVLFFRGDPTRAEVADIAVVLPQLIAAFPGRLQPAVVAQAAEKPLMARFGVLAQPSLALVRADRTLGVIAKIQDWSVYVARIGAMLAADDQSVQQGALS
jgi:hydrogenase-1 operon protein HyaE